MDLAKRLLSEIIGTYILIFTGCGAVMVNEISGGAIGHLGISLIFGLAVIAIVYALGEISGAHINPAVTLGFWARKEFETKLVLPYIIAQCLGATLASWSLHLILPEAVTMGETLPAGTEMQSFVLEVIITFILMFIILQVAIGSKEQGLMAGLAIGLAVALLAGFAGPISGASMNPARSFGPAILAGDLSFMWLYTGGPVIGAGLAAIVSYVFKRDL